jgi:hypothetical protein
VYDAPSAEAEGDSGFSYADGLAVTPGFIDIKRIRTSRSRSTTSQAVPAYGLTASTGVGVSLQRVWWRMKSVIRPSARRASGEAGSRGMKACGWPSNLWNAIEPPALV